LTASPIFLWFSRLRVILVRGEGAGPTQCDKSRDNGVTAKRRGRWMETSCLLVIVSRRLSVALLLP